MSELVCPKRQYCQTGNMRFTGDNTFCAPARTSQEMLLPFALGANSLTRLPALRQAALVLSLVCLVYCLPPVRHLLPQIAAPALAKSPKAERSSKQQPPRVPIADLPASVLEMRDAILSAALHGDLDELRKAIEWNELPPEFGLPDGAEPIDHWRETSKDGNGRDVLAILAELLSSPAAKLPLGRDLENNDIYVWPYVSELDIENLTPAQQVELFRLVPIDDAVEMQRRGKWTWYRLAIGADGTWHVFSKQDR